MDRRVKMLAILYVAVWLLAAAAIIYGFTRTGLPWWSAIVALYFLFLFINGSLAYLARSRKDRAAGKEPPGYWRFIFFPNGAPDFKGEINSLVRIIAGLVAAIGGVLLVGVGMALTLSQGYQNGALSPPALAAAAFVGTAGLVSIYLSWRAFFKRASRQNDAA